MRELYDPSSVEAKWQRRWEEANAYRRDLKNAKKPYFSLVMFPYPSGDKLHVGHWYNFAPADSYGRFMRMHGYDVFEPMGFDAFGLPAENYAIKTGVPPAESTSKNVATMIMQLKRIGCMYDWSRMVNTSEPIYYRWTQWLFLQMYKHGLAYKKEGNVNWCPKDQTVLANEQVWDGKCERCGTDVVQKALEQWYWKTSAYSQKLLDGLDDLDWPEKTKLMQRNWIGRSEGAEVVFDIAGSKESITVFTTRVDTLFSAAFVVLAPEHPLVQILTTPAQKNEIDAYKAVVAKKTELQRTDLAKEKTGVFTGSFAINPATGKRIPVWIGDFVLAHYGHGAVFGDAHDERDFIFAKKYDISLTTTIRPTEGDDDAIRALERCFTGDGTLYDSGEFSGLPSAEARKRIGAWLEKKNKGNSVVTYRLRDWLLSRQRYWGAPIPIVYDPEGAPHPIPEEHLPWMLPTDVEFKPMGKSPLTESKEFIARTEKIFGKGWRPEFDTMDTFVCSSFYYLRYLQATSYKLQASSQMRGTDEPLVDPEIEKRWMPVSMYIGGPEHACMHLIYARFVMMALKEFGLVSHKEPFQKLVHQGLITNKGAKMSKSKGNVVSPDAFVERHGSDVFRMYLMFMGPFTDGGDWNDTGIKGIDRFVQRIWKLFSENFDAASEQDSALQPAFALVVPRVAEEIQHLRFNTAIATLMELLNLLEKQQALDMESAQTFAKLLAPLAPHLSEELWEMTGGAGFIIDQPWPTVDITVKAPVLRTNISLEEAIVRAASNTLLIVIQVNGKVRGSIEVSADAEEKEVLAAAKAQENVAKYLEGKTPKKEIYVSGKLVSFVI